MSYELIVKQGNLLEESAATFIVNASNTKLLLGSGVSMAFKRHCGLGLQKEMSYQLEQLDVPLKKGNVVCTSSAGATNFEYALHAAIMDYNQGVRGNDKLPTLKDIENTLINIELYVQWYYNEKSNKTIKLVLPLLGCGVGGLNKLDVVAVYKSFFLKEVQFDSEVVFYGYNNEDYKIIKRTLFDNK